MKGYWTRPNSETEARSQKPEAREMTKRSGLQKAQGNMGLNYCKRKSH
uniref:Uncharacterized protein n=1 Tax=Nelumbo nucifera TaxID=4432 RepID=A0A822YM62_NELNU|nr:TPA_asm: hypothetical protein HUJ06_005904 [Nelumbo nucifera]